MDRSFQSRGLRSRTVCAVAVSLFMIMVASVVPATAGAHIPVLEPAGPSDSAPSSDAPVGATEPFPAAVDLPDPTISRAVYGTLAAGEAFDAYRFSVAEPAELPVGILVPKRSGLDDFRPVFALVGPALAGGVPATDADALPRSIRDRLRTAADSATAGERPTVVIGRAPAEEWGSFFEPFSFERYHEGPELRVGFVPGRDYYVLVFHPGGEQGDYVLGLGTKEAFGPGDVARSVIAVARIKLGLYGQGELRWGPLAAAVAVVAALVATVALLIRRRRRILREGT